MERHRNPSVNGVFDADCLELGEDPVPGQIVTNNLQRIGSKPITYNNTYPPRNWAVLLQRQLKYVEEEQVRHEDERNQMRVTIQENLFVGYWELVPME